MIKHPIIFRSSKHKDQRVRHDMRIYTLNAGSRPRFCELAGGVGYLPSVQCDPIPVGCGRIWYGELTRIYRDLPAELQGRLERPFPVSPQKFVAVANEVRKALGLGADESLDPGAPIGHYTFKVLNERIADLSSPMIGGHIISQRFVDFLLEGKFTGWDTAPVDLLTRNPADSKPKVFELVVTGSGGEADAYPRRELAIRCPVCGYEKYTRPTLVRLALDPAQWDGSDLFRFEDWYRSYTFLSERLAEALLASRLTNIRLRDMETMMSMWNGTFDIRSGL